MAQPQYAYEFGKRWDVRVPRNDLRRYMGRVHVGTSDDKVAADIEHRCKGKPGYTKAITRQTVAYALELHKRNFTMYCYVMGGR